MAEKTVKITISAQDNFSQTFRAYQQQIGQAATSTRQFDQAAADSGKGVESLASAVGTAVKGFIAFQAINIVSDMVRLGQAANATQATFTALSGGATEAARGLQMMRDATGGIVADTELMAGANRLLAMRIATTSEQAAELSGIAVNLGRAFGQDAASAIENFSLMIANQSLLRLDSLGISASAVRERMKELKEEFPEMDKQARFTQATMEQAAITVDRLGSSITAAQTPVAQLETRFENFKTSIGQSLATTVNSAITSLEQLNAVIEHQLGTTAEMTPDQEMAVIDNAHAFVETWGGAFEEMLGSGFSISGKEILNRIEQARMYLGADASPTDLVEKVGEDMWFDENQVARIKNVYAAVTQEAQRAEQQAARVAQYTSLLSAFRTAEGNAGQPGAAASSFFGGNFGQFGGVTGYGAMSNVTDFLGGTTAAGRQGYADDKLFQFEHNTAGGFGKFLDPAVFDDIKTRFEELQRLNEQGLISDESLEKAEAIKNSAESAANAFKNMSMTDIFGQTSGGMQGQIGDMVIAQMRKAGKSDEEIAAAQRRFDLGSGRETAASLAMQETVAPMIASLPPEEAQKAIENINLFLEAAAKMNLDPATIANLLPGAAGFTAGAGSGQSFSVKSGDTLSALAAQLGIPVETLLAATGASSGRNVQPGTYNLGTGYAPIPGFNPATYAQGYGVPAAGAPGQNPFVAGGFMTQANFDAGFNGQGQNAGAANPADSMKDMEDSSSGIADNMKLIAEQLGDASGKADNLSSSLDLAAASREMTITVNVKDNTKGLLELMIGANKMGTLSFASGGAAGGGTRDNGGRVAGMQPSSSQRGGIP